MLVACPDCRRQYDVGTLAPGTRVRCFCGRGMSVPEPRPRTVAMQHCASCGGALASAEHACPYCGAEPGLAERGLGDPCPECLARLVVGARFCSGCGLAIRPEALVRALTTIDCPRCAGRLADCRGEGRADARARSFVECGSCGGLWLDVESFERLLAERAPAGAAAPGASGASGASGPAPQRSRSLPGAPLGPPPPREPEVRYLACPVCGDRMNRRNFGGHSGVIVDWCRGHGFWFDERELEHVLAFAAAGGLEREKALQAERERLARQRRPAPSPAGDLEALLVERRRPRSSGSLLLDLLVDVASSVLH